MRVIIAGTRTFNDWTLLQTKCNYYIGANKDVEIVSGGAEGADKLGIRYAATKQFPVKVFNADWDRWGPAAGPIRNKEMAKYATHLIAFWNGISRGTKDMISQAEEHGLIVRVVKY